MQATTINAHKPKLLLPNLANHILPWQNLPGAAISLAIANKFCHDKQLCLVITPDIITANRLYHELQFFSPDLPILLFADWETLPYDQFSPHHDIISSRLHTLYRLPQLQQGIVLVAVSTLLKKLPPRDYIEGNSFIFQQGEQLDVNALRQRLQKYGYRRVEQVTQHGEFAVRGSLLDVYPMGSPLPYRLDLLATEIDSIRSFNPETQCSISTVNKIRLLPAHEFPLDAMAITQFRQNWRSEFSGNPANCKIYNEVSQGSSSIGIEYYLPLFFSEMTTLLDYLPSATQLIQIGPINHAINKYWQEVEDRYEQYRYDTTRPLLMPVRWLNTLTEFNALVKPFAPIELELKNFTLADTTLNTKNQLTNLTDFLRASSHRILLCTESNGRREALLEKLQARQLQATLYADWHSFIKDDQPLGIAVAGLEQGLQLNEAKVTVIVEAQLYGQRVLHGSISKTRHQDSGSVIRNLTDLQPGRAVVHIDHGIGLYQGLQTIQTGDLITEYVMLEYAEHNKLYVPVTNLHLMTHYGGMNQDQLTLSSLSNKQWELQREKAARRAYDVAAELLEINAHRQAKPGFKFALPDVHYEAFAEAFPFEETPDQQLAIDKVIYDMTQSHPMDRLVCGDVGFGKTEVAMRATFLAIQSGKQVAILVPTSLLAQQHYETFTDRFADTGASISLLSRFRTATEQRIILEQMASGKIDIVIGTHKLIQNNIKFHDLGLIVIDEEHCFGVQQKERLKALRAEVDILTLTATPIPRTLNMALSGVRDLSIIGTPPAKRLSIKTFLYEYNKNIIRDAILREINRGGQVYYLHNNIDTIEQRTRELQQLLPEASIRVGHGKMRKHELELVMADFYHQRFNILVCTTIIETGIDIPTTNTIIIERADKFGLAQLHQLRGRVGRSHQQAYAYLLVPYKNGLTADAEKRLDAITTIDDLGAGFLLASHDLEIRGAGEFLGKEQTGHIQTIGLALYMDFLERAVDGLKTGKQLDFNQPIVRGSEIDLGVAALIPAHYISDVPTRLKLYQRISKGVDSHALDKLQIEMIDRFGLLPEALKSLFAVTEIKLVAQTLGLRKITINGQIGRFEFTKEPRINSLELIKLIQSHPHIYKLEGPEKLCFVVTELNSAKRAGVVMELMQKLKQC